MFDTKLYWKNRKESKRGQGETPKAKVIPKGENIPGVLNAAGGYRSFAPGGLMRVMNRKEHRSRYVDRTYTASNYEHKISVKDDKGNKINSPHKVNEHKFELPFAPSLTNNQRMKLREMGRIDKAKMKRDRVPV